MQSKIRLNITFDPLCTCQHHSILVFLFSVFSHSLQMCAQIFFPMKPSSNSTSTTVTYTHHNDHTNSPFGPSTTKLSLSTPKSIGYSGWSNNKTQWTSCEPTASKSYAWHQASDLQRWIFLRCVESSCSNSKQNDDDKSIGTVWCLFFFFFLKSSLCWGLGRGEVLVGVRIGQVGGLTT